MNNRERSSFRRRTSAQVIQRRSRSHRRLSAAYDWLIEYRAEILAAFAVLFGTASGWLTGIPWLFVSMLVLTVVLTLGSGLFAATRSRNLSTVISQVEELEIESYNEKEALRRLLRRTGTRFLRHSGYWDAGTCRLSIYGHVEDRFFLICRVSNDPSKSKSGRPSYPDDQGQIQFAWEKGAVDETGWQKDTARKRAVASGMPDDVAARLTMYPRSMVGLRVENSEGSATGIILLESSEPHELDEALDLMSQSVIFQTLSDAVVASESVFEPLSEPSDSGPLRSKME